MTQHSENASQQQPTTQRVGDQPRQQQPRDVPPHMAGVGRTANLLITRQNFSFTPGEEPIDLTSGPLWVSADFFKVLSHGGSNEGVANRVIGNFLTVLFNLGIKLDCKGFRFPDSKDGAAAVPYIVLDGSSASKNRLLARRSQLYQFHLPKLLVVPETGWEGQVIRVGIQASAQRLHPRTFHEHILKTNPFLIEINNQQMPVGVQYLYPIGTTKKQLASLGPHLVREMMSIFAHDVTVLVWQVIAPTKMDPLNFTAGVYPYPLTVADMAVNTPPANLARPPAVSTTAEVRVTLASSSLGSSVLGRKRGRDDIEEDVQTRKSDVQTRKSAGSTRSAASTRERERVMEEAAKNMSAAAAKMREAAETKEKVGKDMSTAAAKMREATEKKEKVELWQKQMEELDEEADGLYEEGEELFEAAKRSGDATE